MDWKKTLLRIMRRRGYEIRKTPLASSGVFDNLEECKPLLAQIQHRTFVTPEGLISLYNQVRYCEKNNIPGSFVECGVWKAGAVGLMALANLAHGAARRDLHLFDAFTDICEPDAAVDGERAVREASAHLGGARPAGAQRPVKGFYDKWGGPGGVEDDRRFLVEELGYEAGRIHFHEGWFQDTLPRDATALGPIALLRIDADWYAGTKICLEYLHRCVVPGGFVIIDDYGTYEGCRRATDEFLAGLPAPVFLNPVDAAVRYWIKPA